MMNQGSLQQRPMQQDFHQEIGNSAIDGAAGNSLDQAIGSGLVDSQEQARESVAAFQQQLHNQGELMSEIKEESAEDTEKKTPPKTRPPGMQFHTEL